MQTLTQTVPAQRPTPFTTLFVRYVTGQIAEPTWEQLSSLVDSVSDATQEEREAMASFVQDALRDLGAEAVPLPSLNEAQEVLRGTRLAA